MGQMMEKSPLVFLPPLRGPQSAYGMQLTGCFDTIATQRLALDRAGLLVFIPLFSAPTTSYM